MCVCVFVCVCESSVSVREKERESVCVCVCVCGVCVLVCMYKIDVLQLLCERLCKRSRALLIYKLRSVCHSGHVMFHQRRAVPLSATVAQRAPWWRP